MASGPLSTYPTSLDDLPSELCWTLAQYLGERDLGKMRLLSGYWNATAKTTLRLRKRFLFNFENANKLGRFNDTFARYIPTDDIAAGRFCFKLAALDTVDATVALATFVQEFGHLVTSLTVNATLPNYHDPREWYNVPSKRATVLGHLTILLQGVKGQVEDLELLYYAGLHPCVVGNGPFPRLRSLTVGNNPLRGGPSELGVLEEASILLLARSAPAIQRFEFKNFIGFDGGDPRFLSNVLRTLGGVNGQVEVKLEMNLAHFTNGDGALLTDLMTAAVRIVELDLILRRDLGTLRRALDWIGAQSDWLKKLKFMSEIEVLPVPLTLPSLRVLEELEYVEKTVGSLLQCDSPNYFPKLRKVTTASTGKDFTVTLPQVTDLTVCRTPATGIGHRDLGKYGQVLFQLPPFPNVETLTLSVKFIDLGSIVKLQRLRRLTFTPDPDSRNCDSFWKRVTNGAWKLTLEQIRALPEPSENEVRERAEPCFSDVANLEELKMVVPEYRTDLATVNLNALLFISKTKRLQRLKKLELEVKRNSVAALQIHITELRHHHNLVFVSET